MCWVGSLDQEHQPECTTVSALWQRGGWVRGGGVCLLSVWSFYIDRILKNNSLFLFHRGTSWSPVAGCEHVQRPLVCSLTEAIQSHRERHFVQVEAKLAGQTSKPATSDLTPFPISRCSGSVTGWPKVCVCVRSTNVPFVFIQIIWTYLSWPSPPAMRTCVWTSTLLLKTRGSTMIGFTTSWKLKTAECTQPRYNNNNNSLCQCHVCVTQTFTPCVAFAKLRGLA